VRISVRTLHSRFKLIGKSFGHWALDSRFDCSLRQCREESHAEA
jgi:hypothetical protein